MKACNSLVLSGPSVCFIVERSSGQLGEKRSLRVDLYSRKGGGGERGIFSLGLLFCLVDSTCRQFFCKHVHCIRAAGAGLMGCRCRAERHAEHLCDF